MPKRSDEYTEGFRTGYDEGKNDGYEQCEEAAKRGALSGSRRRCKYGKTKAGKCRKRPR
jgi:flagellar biosynthesis/type III secretory pathway protein FliH